MKRSNLESLIARCMLAAVLLPFASAASGQSARFGTDFDFVHDSNVTRGLDPDRRSDNILSAEGYVGRSFYLGPRSGAVLRAGLRYSHFTDFKDLSNLALSGRAAYRIQPVAGFSAPWLEVATDLAWLKHSDSELRDGTIGTLSASAGSLLTDRVSATAGGGVQKRSSKDPSGLYDLSTKRIWATLDYRVGVQAALYGRATRIAGDHVFTAADPASKGALIPLAAVIAFDPALQRGYTGGLTPFGYRIKAKTTLFELGFNYPLSGHDALDFGVSRSTSKTDAGSRYYGDQKYDDVQVRAAYLYRF